jgi:hypothetical protein
MNQFSRGEPELRHLMAQIWWLTRHVQGIRQQVGGGLQAMGWTPGDQDWLLRVTLREAWWKTIEFQYHRDAALVEIHWHEKLLLPGDSQTGDVWARWSYIDVCDQLVEFLKAPVQVKRSVTESPYADQC